MKYITAIALCVAALVILGLIILDLAYMSHGSLEMFPTAEDNESTRIFTIMMLLVLVPIGATCVFCAIKSWPSHKRKNAEQAADGDA
jgi:lysylphosphatidylglycerol synthetase-like protein (DUF2156 family)